MRRGNGLARPWEALCGYEEEDTGDVSRLVGSLSITPEAMESIPSTAQTRRQHVFVIPALGEQREEVRSFRSSSNAKQVQGLIFKRKEKNGDLG